MAVHRFKIGDAVTAYAPGIPPGPYIIIQLLPLVGDEPHYQMRGGDGVVRALPEKQIRTIWQGPRNE
jgi:hypothetical protein